MDELDSHTDIPNHPLGLSQVSFTLFITEPLSHSFASSIFTQQPTPLSRSASGDTLNIAVNCDEPRNPDSSTSGAIDRSRPTVILLHGYMGHPKKPWIESMALRTHQFFDANVCIVDWATLAALELNLSVAKLKEVGQRIGECLCGLVDARQESELQRVSLIGYGLGAHLAGCVGKNFNGRLGRIFGLDPLVECSEELLSAGFRLSSRDARLVQVAHTSIGTYGAYRPSGHQDFYFNNGGRSPQPGCSRLPTYQQTACSHFRAVEYLFHSMNETNEFYDTRRREKFGFFTGGKSGRFLVITGSKPPYAD